MLARLLDLVLTVLDATHLARGYQPMIITAVLVARRGQCINMLLLVERIGMAGLSQRLHIVVFYVCIFNTTR